VDRQPQAICQPSSGDLDRWRVLWAVDGHGGHRRVRRQVESGCQHTAPVRQPRPAQVGIAGRVARTARVDSVAIRVTQ
nr:hypothetical protein [Escherichia coli]